MSEKKFTVTEITELIKRQLENTFSSVIVEGELSNCKLSSTGHLFWTLKDMGASISGVMFKSNLRYLDFTPSDGTLVRVRGRVTVWGQRGLYQLVADSMEEAGTGDILALLERRKKKLADAGLFDEDRKKPIPRFPERVAVVSSPTGAALRDILNILKRRASGIDVIILPCPVQGSEAAQIIARRIEQANQWNLADVIIVGRGGGSLEDLLPFSEESVVRAAADSKIPIVSAVGHEIDWALIDFVSDLRAPTPSAAAELVSENYSDTITAVQSFSYEMHRSICRLLERAALLIKPFSSDYLERAFRSILQPRLLRFDDAKEVLLDAMQVHINEKKHRLDIVVTKLESSSPKNIMKRGYSIVVNTKTGNIVKKKTDAASGDILQIKLLKDSIIAKTIAVANQASN
ncbi:MAG: exodeoxyribonuclease VII large subunit [Termitinemataceae bacterium]|nr:MAG: exodeoxyribonuclease VII large subunit [Termitinemataceae bacterium]